MRQQFEAQTNTTLPPSRSRFRSISISVSASRTRWLPSQTQLQSYCTLAGPLSRPGNPLINIAVCVFSPSALCASPFNSTAFQAQHACCVNYCCGSVRRPPQSRVQFACQHEALGLINSTSQRNMNRHSF